MPIRYKVIKRKSRCSAVVNGNSRYALKYIPGITVLALEGTLGVMVFKTITPAKKFAANLNSYSYEWTDKPPRYIVVRVATYGKGKFIYEIAYDYTTQGISNYYNDSIYHDFMTTAIPMEYTMGYPGVTPLE